MKQYKITSENILQNSEDDCYLAPDDPIHELKIAHYLGGLGSAERLAQYKLNQINTRPIVEQGYGKTTTGFKSRIRKHI